MVYAVRFVALPQRHRVFRVLFEIEEQDVDRAQSVLADIQKVLNNAEIKRPILLHGFDATVWHFVREAFGKRWSTRVGLEDGRTLENNSVADSNAQLVTEATALLRESFRPYSHS